MIMTTPISNHTNPLKAALVVRAYNRVRKPGLAASRRLEPDPLIQRARERSGLNDFGDTDYLERFHTACEAMDKNGALTPFGRTALQANLTGHLIARLKTVSVLKRYPELGERPPHAPVFIVGLYRTGTTLLHQLFHQLPSVSTPLYWQLETASTLPRISPLERMHHKTRAALRLASHRRIAPEFRHLHGMSWNGPEECLFLMESAGLGTSSMFLTEDKEWAFGALERDPLPAYRFFAKQLSLFCHRFAAPNNPSQRQWVFKWPFHTWHLPALLEVFPDAQIVLCERDLREACVSVCNLAIHARAAMVTSIDLPALGAFFHEFSKLGVKRAEAALSGHNPYRVAHPELTAEPLDAFRNLATTLGLWPQDEQLSATLSTRLRAFLERNQQRTKPRVRFERSQLGL